MKKRLAFCLFAMMTLIAACEEEPSEPLPVPQATDFAFVTTTDFQTGSASVIGLDGDPTVQNNIAAIHSDAVARFFGGLIYVVNRFGADNVQILDPATDFATVRQFSVGNGSDPHDIVVMSPTKAYVTRYNETDLWIVNPSTGNKTGSVDLSELADDDGIPEMDHLILEGDRLLVTVQRIDRNGDWGPVGTSYVAMVDVNTDALIDIDPLTNGTQPMKLAGSNPFSEFALDPVSGEPCVAAVGDWGVLDGGIERIDPVGFSTQVILTGAAAQGDITDVALASATTAFAIITDASFNNKLIAFNPQNGAVTGTVYAPGAFVLQDAEIGPSGRLFATDRTATLPGIRVYDTQTLAEITTAPIDVGLPPFDIIFGRR